MSDDLIQPFDRMLADAAPPAVVRAIDTGGSADAVWSAISHSGFLDALVTEGAGGAGLTLGEVDPLLRALGARAVPVPVAETMVGRALLADAGVDRPEGAIVLAVAYRQGQGWATAAVPLGGVAACALIHMEGELRLVDLDEVAVESVNIHGSRSAVLRWQADPRERARFTAPEGGLRPLAAIIRATAIAGAGDRLLDMTTAYANERVQFGKPIGRQQAIQQQLAVMAQHAVAARIAAQMGCAGGLSGAVRAAAIAKIVTSQAVVPLATIAHAVHGAIGISEEYDLQLYTRRLHEWRIADGSESYWSERLGSARMAINEGSVAFVRGMS